MRRPPPLAPAAEARPDSSARLLELIGFGGVARDGEVVTRATPAATPRAAGRRWIAGHIDRHVTSVAYDAGELRHHRQIDPHPRLDVSLAFGRQVDLCGLGNGLRRRIARGR
ncbi:hypothetical protein GCM10009527_096490 [Actinomadura nitritigenes]